MAFLWSDEVIKYLNTQDMRLLPPVIYDGDNLLADIQLQILKRKKREMKGQIDRLKALPFFGMNDDDFYTLNAANTNSKAICERKSKDDTWGIESDFLFRESGISNSTNWESAEAGLDGQGWGNHVDSGFSDDTTPADDDYDFFGRPTSSNRSSAALSCFSSLCEKTDSSCGFTPISKDWAHPLEKRHASEEFNKLIRKLQWKFPYAFKGSEKTVADTEDAMRPYMEAADFLIKQTKRFRSQSRIQQEQSFRWVTEPRIAKEYRWTRFPVVDWANILKETGKRMAQRKIRKKSPLSNEL